MEKGMITSIAELAILPAGQDSKVAARPRGRLGTDQLTVKPHGEDVLAGGPTLDEVRTATHGAGGDDVVVTRLSL